MTQEEQDYLETTKVTLTLLGYSVKHYKNAANSYKERIYIESNNSTPFAFYFDDNSTNIILLNFKTQEEINSTNIIELCQHLLKHISPNTQND